MFAVRGCIPGIATATDPKLDSAKLDALVDMRMPHDGDGDVIRDKWYRGMANMTGGFYWNSLDVKQTRLPRTAAQQRSIAERIHERCSARVVSQVGDRVHAGFHSYRTKTGVGHWGSRRTSA